MLSAGLDAVLWQSCLWMRAKYQLNRCSRDKITGNIPQQTPLSIKGIKRMTKDAAAGKKLSAGDAQQLQAMAPTLV